MIGCPLDSNIPFCDALESEKARADCVLLGWQSQTNSLSTGISPNWFDVPGSASSTSAVLNMNPANATVFYRLRHP
jgi:hypothetical protein